ncbi:uncharacterized protein BP01DRAFT_83424 [Aspergillus saccharolyticus JOP 1030-1]|uniref:Uncharacterized protein n=1 Tax=Aspergillus saccharolyticus JOP 1030-1 TaxID=1450539 RepID=A0A318ZDV0_9EURO|nr:hypothetical protein BP01DRAFT_83424 [Aspergillus saccharolyticus JOP 1030-1]PYH44464.1 hypothetical protein BP01DRAFT_83424 [Aspergillus saccharolyticus JOP 1030-1]
MWEARLWLVLSGLEKHHSYCSVRLVVVIEACRGRRAPEMLADMSGLIGFACLTDRHTVTPAALLILTPAIGSCYTSQRLSAHEQDSGHLLMVGKCHGKPLAGCHFSYVFPSELDPGQARLDLVNYKIFLLRWLIPAITKAYLTTETSFSVACCAAHTHSQRTEEIMLSFQGNGVDRPDDEWLYASIFCDR